MIPGKHLKRCFSGIFFYLFLATFSFLVSNKDNPRYKPTFDGLKEILNSYGIDGKKFEASFLQFCPRGEAPEENEEFKLSRNSKNVIIGVFVAMMIAIAVGIIICQ